MIPSLLSPCFTFGWFLPHTCSSFLLWASPASLTTVWLTSLPSSGPSTSSSSSPLLRSKGLLVFSFFILGPYTTAFKSLVRFFHTRYVIRPSGTFHSFFNLAYYSTHVHCLRSFCDLIRLFRRLFLFWSSPDPHSHSTSINLQPFVSSLSFIFVSSGHFRFFDWRSSSDNTLHLSKGLLHQVGLHSGSPSHSSSALRLSLHLVLALFLLSHRR